MDNNYNNDQQNTNSEPYGQENGYSDTPAQEQNNSYPAQNDVQNTYGQNDGNGYGSQNGQYGQQQNGMNYGPQNGQPQGGAPYGPQNSPYGQQGGYPQNPYQQQPPVEGSLGLAIASMVLGISAALFACCFYPISFLLALVGLILGAVAIKKGPAGKGFAITGLVLSVISIALAVIILLFAATLGIGTGLSELF